MSTGLPCTIDLYQLMSLVLRHTSFVLQKPFLSCNLTFIIKSAGMSCCIYDLQLLYDRVQVKATFGDKAGQCAYLSVNFQRKRNCMFRMCCEEQVCCVPLAFASCLATT